jgi:hypothetical protein
MSTPEPPGVAAPAPPAAPRPKRTHPTWVVAVALFAGFVTGFVVGLFLPAPTISGKPSQDAAAGVLADARDFCVGEDAAGVELSDGGLTLVIDSKGEEDATGLSAFEAWCLLAALDLPTSARSHIEQTTSMDGRQSETWNGITFAWSYHPNRGMDGVLTIDPAAYTPRDES